MLTIKDRNVNGVYAQAMRLFMNPENEGSWWERHPSRNGDMLEFVAPVVTTYEHPNERVLFDPVRDCNPFLHFFESLWMIHGRNDLAFLANFTKNMANFSDDGVTLNGAYGHRWRHHFGYDQLVEAVAELAINPMSRRVVTTMWDADSDLQNQKSKDLPCNTSIFWRLRNDRLDMTVTNRSNDAVWGCYGANAVHFSFLQEYMASYLGVKVGQYHQVSNSLHIYPDLPVVKRIMDGTPPDGEDCHYAENLVVAYPLMSGGATHLQFHTDMDNFFSDRRTDWEDWETDFFREVVTPMWMIHKMYKAGELNTAIQAVEAIDAPDWRRAVREWLQRRAGK